MENIIGQLKREYQFEDESAAGVMEQARVQAYIRLGDHLYGHEPMLSNQKRNKRPIPACIKRKVRQAFPDPHKKYSGI